MKLNQKGFAAVEAILIVIVLGILGFTGWFVWHTKQAADKTPNSTVPTTQKKAATTKVTTPADNQQYLVMNEWGLRFKVPSGLTDVQYRINGETANFYAKPTGSSVQYRAGYDTLKDGYSQYALGVLYRSTSSTKPFDSADGTQTREGKKVGNYYYYTNWAFSSLSTGAACVGLYGDDGSNCQSEGTAFQLVNQGGTALLNTIELAQ